MFERQISTVHQHNDAYTSIFHLPLAPQWGLTERDAQQTPPRIQSKATLLRIKSFRVKSAIFLFFILNTHRLTLILLYIYEILFHLTDRLLVSKLVK